MQTKIITEDVSAAADIIKSGGIVAVPTETVYGLAVNCFNEKSVQRVYEIKGREENKALSILVSGKDAIDSLCKNVPKLAFFLADCFWPGPLTMILDSNDNIPDIVKAGGKTVGLRCPKQEQTLELLQITDLPLAAPSANPSGKKSPLSAEDVLKYFDGKIDAVIDGGACELGLESTILDLSKTPYIILRRGAIAENELNLALFASLTIIGITGGTGSGKTTALDTVEKMGGLVIDSDEVYHTLLRESGPMRAELSEHFPGVSDTKELGKIVFNDKDALATLNSITHRYIGEEIMRKLLEWTLNGGELAAIDAIALVEGGIGNYCKATVAITADTDIRIQRLIDREGISREYARLRIEAQKPDEYYIEVCDYALENNGTREEFSEKCRVLFENIIGR